MACDAAKKAISSLIGALFKRIVPDLHLDLQVGEDARPGEWANLLKTPNWRIMKR